jgi:hypothetical protein
MHASVWCSVLVFAVLVDASVDTDTGLGEDGFKLFTAANAGGRHLLSKHGRIRLHKVSKKQRKHKRISLRGTVKCGNPGKVCAVGIIAILCAFKLITLLASRAAGMGVSVRGRWRCWGICLLLLPGRIQTRRVGLAKVYKTRLLVPKCSIVQANGPTEQRPVL